jgi:hypothetical protein
LTKE